MSSFLKRKYRERRNNSPGRETTNYPAAEGRESSPDPILYIQAHEADVIRGPHAATAALSLESHNRTQDETLSHKTGDALILWRGSQSNTLLQPLFPEDEDGVHGKAKLVHESGPAIWVDRYDARLLLDALPSAHTNDTTPSRSIPDSPGGWSDLPSDTEDLFFFSSEEADDIRRERKRRHIEQLREERLKAMYDEDDEQSLEEVWGGSDEEPDEVQKGLMHRTATHLLSSPNTAQLEMRILANHGSDPRFAFLRGRWSRSWKITKRKAKIEKEAKEKEVAAQPLGVLAGYGDSDAESGNDEIAIDGCSDEAPESRAPASSSNVMPPGGAEAGGAEDAETAAKEARRARAKKWTEQRRQKTEDVLSTSRPPSPIG